MTEFAQSQVSADGVCYEFSTYQGKPIIETVAFCGGVFAVDHQLPPAEEVVTVLRATGMDNGEVAQIVGRSTGQVKRALVDVYSALGIAEHSVPRLMPVALGRLCLESSVLRLVEPIPVQHQPSEKYLQILTQLGQGVDWSQAALSLGWKDRNSPRQYAKSYHKEAETGLSGVTRAVPLLLHAYGAKLLDPALVVDGQPWPAPQLPLVMPEHTPPARSSPKSVRLQSDTLLLPSQRPEPFAPFKDPDKIIYLTQREEHDFGFSHIEVCGAVLEVKDRMSVVNPDGQTVELDSRDKLALLMLTMGANKKDIIRYCLDKERYTTLLEAIAAQGGRISALHHREAVQLACRYLLHPITPPEWLQGVPDFNWLDTYLNLPRRCERDTNDSRFIRFVGVGSTYSLEERRNTQTISLMVLLGHAAGLLEVDP